MKYDENVLKEFIGLLDQTISLLRQDIVSLRNDFMQQKMELEQIKFIIETYKDDKGIRAKYVIACLTAGASVTIAVLQYLIKR